MTAAIGSSKHPRLSVVANPASLSRMPAEAARAARSAGSHPYLSCRDPHHGRRRQNRRPPRTGCRLRRKYQQHRAAAGRIAACQWFSFLGALRPELLPGFKEPREHALVSAKVLRTLDRTHTTDLFSTPLIEPVVDCAGLTHCGANLLRSKKPWGVEFLSLRMSTCYPKGNGTYLTASVSGSHSKALKDMGRRLGLVRRCYYHCRTVLEMVSRPVG